MTGKKRTQTDLAVPEAVPAAENSRNEAAAVEVPAKKKKLAMERKKERKELDKERHRQSAESAAAEAAKAQPPAAEAAAPAPANPPPASVAVGPGLHMNVFRDLASPEASVREAAAEALVVELRQVQKAYEKSARNGQNEAGDGESSSQMEAEKGDGLDNCAPSVRYAIRRLIRGISSSREYVRQGFALGLAAVLESIRAIKVESIMKLIPNLLEYSSSMKGPEAKDNLLGRLFGFGAIVRSGRVSRQWARDKSSPIVKEFVSVVVELGGKKRYLTEPAVAVILDLVRKIHNECSILSSSTSSCSGLDTVSRLWHHNEEVHLFQRADALLATGQFFRKIDLYKQLAVDLHGHFPDTKVHFTEGTVKNKCETFRSRWRGPNSLRTTSGGVLNCSERVANFLFSGTTSGSEPTNSIAADSVNVTSVNMNGKVPPDVIVVIESLQLTDDEKAKAIDLAMVDQGLGNTLKIITEEGLRVAWIKRHLAKID